MGSSSQRQVQRQGVARILNDCPVIEVAAGEPHFKASFSRAELLAVEQGFIVVRSAPEGVPRSIVTSEAGAGSIVLPPTEEEVLYALVPSSLIAIDAGTRDRILEAPTSAGTLLASLASALARKQEALAIFAYTHHVDRVRRKLLQLAEGYGRVAGDGIRIDFPVSHTLLAEMIGSSRETVTRALDELQQEGFVARRGHTYRLLVSPERVAEGDVTAITRSGSARVLRSGSHPKGGSGCA